MKRILAILLAILMLTSLAVFPTAAETDPLNGYMELQAYQYSEKPTGTSGNDQLYSLRLVATHGNTEEYSSFGYKITIKYTDLNGTAQTKTLTDPIKESRVYANLKAGGETIDVKEKYGADYASGVVITNVPASAGDLTIEVTPFVDFLDSRGTVEGKTLTIDHDLTVTTMTFNIRNWEQNQNNHLERLILTIKEADYPDVIGFQEMGMPTPTDNWDWRAKIMADTDIANCYNWYGVNRGDRTGESCVIFYKKDKFELIESESGTRWLYCNCENAMTTACTCTGETTAGNLLTKNDLDIEINGVYNDQNDAGHKAYGYDYELYNRILTYAKLRRKSDNKEFFFFNTHLEINTYAMKLHGAGTVQNKQIEYILNFAKSLTENAENPCPIIMTGDFNARNSTTNCDVLTDIAAAGFIRTENEAYETVGAEVPTNSSYKYCGGTNTPTSGIDHIFILTQYCFVRQYTFCDQPIEYGGLTAYASDHIPRIAEYIIW